MLWAGASKSLTVRSPDFPDIEGRGRGYYVAGGSEHYVAVRVEVQSQNYSYDKAPQLLTRCGSRNLI